jgi:hypothetical protein
MKMNRQNPGGEGSLKTGYAPGQMKKFDKKADGDLKPYGLTTKYSAREPGLSGMAKGAHVQKSGHANKSFTGSTVTGTFRDFDD